MLTCCQLVRKGRYVAAEPWLEPGATIALGDAKRRSRDVGQLALVAHGRSVGRVMEILGPVGSVHAAMRGLLGEAGLRGALPREVDDQLAALGDEVPLREHREDRRSDLIVTIDPPTARDHDDAISLEPINGSGGDDGPAWRLWVHIADVAAYVPPGSPIDRWAASRAMSAYVPGAVAPMLPKRLSSDLCSLLPGVDRGCVSMCSEIHADGSVGDVRFCRTIIRSARRLSYDQVDEVLGGRASIDPIIDELLRGIDGVTRLLRARRIERGALDMALPEVELVLGEHDPTEARLAHPSASHRLVEECMLVANDAVGLRLAQSQSEGIWRIHDHPDPEAIDALFRQFSLLGIPTPAMPEQISGREAAALAASAAAAAQRFANQRGRGTHTFAPRVLRSLKQAMYRDRSGVHSGLATEHYAHFTSPIRRYPDLINHRSLLRLIGASDDPPSSDDLADVANHVNEVERELQRLERRADRIAIAHLLHRTLHAGEAMGDTGDGVWAGEVTGLIGAGLFVRFGDVYEGFVPARTLSPAERYELDEHGLAMEGTRSGHRIRLGDAIRVYVDRVDRAAGKIDLRPVAPR